MVIGLTGPNAAGKGEAAIYIKSKSFIYHSLSDILREEAKKSGIEPSRENLINLGNELRRKNGPAFLAVRAMKRLAAAEDHIVDSIRNPGEIEALRKTKDFILLGIDGPVETRFNRILKRNREGDPKTLEEFIKKEAEENKAATENQQLNNCLEKADEIIINDSTIEEFHKKIDEAIKKNKKT
ncbi:MAG: AAA family ATPase [Candidatus Omnitrophica bacterium]|nr:AAA family ATPase [Candidatus Omnitrophota bacterium]MBU4589467.1 AAA family ATPase [Candidatus Omnitrophota bacterium]